MTRDDWDRLVMWTALLVYFAVWTIIPSLALGGHVWFVGVSWATVYVSFHVLEITARGRCYLSADSTALPAAAVTAVIVAIVLSPSGIISVTADRFAYVQAFAFSFVLGHVLSLLYSALANQLGVVIDRAFSRRNGRKGTLIPRNRGMAELARSEEELKRKKERY